MRLTPQERRALAEPRGPSWLRARRSPDPSSSFDELLPDEVHMPLPVEDLEIQALRLPPEDRARLLERLIASFEPKSPAQSAWMQLAQRRREEVQVGQSAMVPGDEALARVKARLA